MFWRFGGYANISTIDTLLDKPDATLEELLDDADLLQELKQHNAKLIEYLREENVLRRLLEYIVAPKASDTDDAAEQGDDGASRGGASSASAPSQRSGGVRFDTHGASEEEAEREERARRKYANVACEILSSDTRSIIDTLMENRQHLRQFWICLNRNPPLDPIEAGYFTKVNENLLDKKTEEMLAFLKTMDDAVENMLRHVDCPVVMDLLLKIISLEKVEGGQGIIDWLHSHDLIPGLLSFLSEEYPSATQTSAGDFLKAVITISANASQNEQSCIGPNELTRQLVSEPCIRNLIGNMLRGGSALTVGVGVIIEVIRKNNSDYDPDVGVGLNTLPSSRDPIYLGTLLRMFAQSIPDFMSLILNPKHGSSPGGSGAGRRRELKVASGGVIEPLGFDRFKTCELMAELLHCSNMALLNEPGSENYIKQRDRERERLKAEGILPYERELRSGTEFADNSMIHSGDPASAHHDLDPFHETRRLEIANGGEDDGFEDVTISGVLNDEARDAFNDGAGIEREERSSRETGSFGEQPAERHDYNSNLEANSDQEHGRSEEYEQLHLMHQEQSKSPTSAGMTARVGTMYLDDSTDPMMDDRPDLSHATDAHAETSHFEQPSTSTIRSDSDNDLPPRTTDFSPRLPSSPTTPTNTNNPGTLSPHAEDQPAPLFSDRPEHLSHPQQPESDPVAEGDTEHGNNSPESINTTLGDGGDSIRSVLMGGNDACFEHLVEPDIDGSLVVGDYLKMVFVEHRVVPTILDFFFRFPWNNFLHNVVYDVVQQVFNGPMDRGFNRNLAIDLFDSGRITERIVEGQRQSDEAQTRSNMRLGYMGHLTLIAEEVVKFTERHPPEFLSKSVLDLVMSNEWVDYVEHILAETRERDNAILGGVRPDMSAGPRQAVINSLNAAQNFGNTPSAALANAGLTGGGGGGAAGLDSIDLMNGNTGASTGFGFGSNHLLSAFGSSSDEDDEEMEDDTEAEDSRGMNGEAQNQALHSNTSSATFGHDESESSNAPSPTIPKIPPPPPPPLNIPPSRARRQLAARLAMKLKAKQEEEHAAASNSSNSNGGDGTHERHENAPSQLGEARIDDDDDDDDEEQAGEAADTWAPRPSLQELELYLSPAPSISSSSSSSDDDDLSQRRNSAAEGSSMKTNTVAAATRSVLEVDDDDDEDDDDDDVEEEDEEEGEVVDFEHGDENMSEDEEDDGADLVEIKRSAVGRGIGDEEGEERQGLV
ncbi:MAG: hypothetical protein M1816_003450 [Peltula sp. TS41687]|nr:MAG: hypothetical protein M1816_003450 [Peltula sp. TS41687]